MFGEEAPDVSGIAELQDELIERDAPRRAVLSNDVVLELDGVSAFGIGSELGIEEVSLQVRQGEILGIAGVDGNGQRALAEAVAGQRIATTGEVRLFGVSINKLNVAQRQKLGLRYVTDDRLGEGIVRSMGVDHQPLPQARRAGALLALRPHPARRGRAHRDRARARVRRAHARA